MPSCFFGVLSRISRAGNCPVRSTWASCWEMTERVNSVEVLARHAASVAAKDVKEWRCCSEKELVGYVEPVPEFYLAMVDLLCAFEATLCARGKPSLRHRAAEISDMWEAIEEAGLDDVEQFLRVRPEYSELAREVLGFDAHSACGSKADIGRYADAGVGFLTVGHGRQRRIRRRRTVRPPSSIPKASA